MTAVIGVLASLSVASFNTVASRARMQRDADGVEDLVRRARNLARAERRCVRVDATTNRISLTPVAHALGAPADCLGGADVVDRRQTLALPAGVRLAPNAFFFDRAGGAVGAVAGVPQEIVVTVSAPGLPIRIFTVRALVGAGAVSRRG